MIRHEAPQIDLSRASIGTTTSNLTTGVPTPKNIGANRKDQDIGRGFKIRQDAPRRHPSGHIASDVLLFIPRNFGLALQNLAIISTGLTVATLSKIGADNWHKLSAGTLKHIHESNYLYAGTLGLTCAAVALLTLGGFKLYEAVYKRLLTNLIKPLQNEGTLISTKVVRETLESLARRMGKVTDNIDIVNEVIDYLDKKYPMGSTVNLAEKRELQEILDGTIDPSTGERIGGVQSRNVLKTRIVKFFDATVMRVLFSGIGYDKDSAKDNAKKDDLAEPMKDILKAMGEIWKWSVGGPQVLGQPTYLSYVKPEINTILAWFYEKDQTGGVEKSFKFQSKAIQYYSRKTIEPALYAFTLAGGVSLLAGLSNAFLKSEMITETAVNLLNIAKAAGQFCMNNPVSGTVGALALSYGVLMAVSSIELFSQKIKKLFE